MQRMVFGKQINWKRLRRRDLNLVDRINMKHLSSLVVLQRQQRKSHLYLQTGSPPSGVLQGSYSHKQAWLILSLALCHLLRELLQYRLQLCFLHTHYQRLIVQNQCFQMMVSWSQLLVRNTVCNKSQVKPSVEQRYSNQDVKQLVD